MKENSPFIIVDGVQCKVINGVHARKSGIVRDIKRGKLVIYPLLSCNQTEKDLKRCKKRGCNKDLIQSVVQIIQKNVACGEGQCAA